MLDIRKGVIYYMDMEARHMVIQFQFNGTTYRTDGKIVGAKDGNSWNKTGSLNVILEARKLFKAPHRSGLYVSDCTCPECE